jgi:outer membrane protein assembly factor BamA
VIALRALATMTDADAGDQVPFYLQPYLGSGETLRGFANRRFRDRNRLLLAAEYRWRPSRFLDMALFVDAGSVAPRRQDLSLDDLHTSYGIGIRMHGPTTTPLRLELARSREGTVLVIGSGAAF